MPKQPTSVRLPNLTTRQLTELIATTGMTQSEIVSTAIDRMHREEIKTMTSIANSASSICNYCGAIYDAMHGAHICNVDELQTLINQERTMTDEPDEGQIAKLEARIVEVRSFWETHPKHRGELSHSISA
jgi:predicted DNA-binding protein